MSNQKDFQRRIKNVENVLKKILEENRLKLTTAIDFPKYRQLPMSLQLALILIKEEGGIIVRKYSPLKEKRKKKAKKEKNAKK